MKKVKQDRVCRKTGKVIGVRWRLEEYNPDKQRYEPIPVAQIPEHIRFCEDERIVDGYIKSQNAIVDAIKHRAEELRKWREQYHDHKAYLEKFSKFQERSAPNSFKNDLFYLENYAFGYFLSKSNLNNMNLWRHEFNNFRTWLSEVKPLKQRKEKLAINTQVKIIKSLNRFLTFAAQEGWIEVSPRCPTFRREETLTVSVDDLIRDDEIPAIREVLKQIRPISEELFVVLKGTGLRLNEALGLNPDFLSQGKISGQYGSTIHDRLEKCGLGEYHGYIVLESQPALSSLRCEEGWKEKSG